MIEFIELFGIKQQLNYTFVSRQINIMISDIVKNSHRLIRKQIQENGQLYGEIIRIKNKKNNSNMFKSANIFQEPDFNSNPFKRVTVANIKYGLFKQNKNLTQRQNSYRQQQKSIQIKKSYNQNPQKNTNIHLQEEKDPKIIHSRKNNRFLSLNKPSNKYQLKKKGSLKITNKLSSNFIHSFVQQPGFMNLCFYKNSLQKVQSARSPRLKNISRQDKRKKNIQIQQIDKRKKKSHYRHEYNASKHDCRPWSPIRQNESVQLQISGNFKSLTLKVDGY